MMKRNGKVTATAVALAGLLLAGSATAREELRVSQPDLRVAPSALLAIDQNRATVVERIVSEWGVESAALGLTPDQMRARLIALRADDLMAASVAGTVAGLRDVLARAATGESAVTHRGVEAKALGSATVDLVYTPVVPCRIVDTRNPGAGGAFAAGGETRNYHAYAASFATQGGSATDCGIPNNPSAVALNFTAVGGGGFLVAWPYNSAMPTASILNPTGVATMANGAIVPLCRNCSFEFSVFTYSAQVIVDVVGFFMAPAATALECVNTSITSFNIAANATNFFNNPSCPAGYAATTPYCWTASSGVYSQGSGYNANAAGNATFCSWQNTTNSSQQTFGGNVCCRIPGR